MQGIKKDIEDVKALLRLNPSYVIALLNASMGDSLGVSTEEDFAFFKRHFEITRDYVEEIAAGRHVQQILTLVSPKVRRSELGEPLNTYGLFVDMLRGHRRFYKRLYAISSKIIMDQSGDVLPAIARVCREEANILDHRVIEDYKKAIQSLIKNINFEKLELMYDVAARDLQGFCRDLFICPLLKLHTFYVPHSKVEKPSKTTEPKPLNLVNTLPTPKVKQEVLPPQPVPKLSSYEVICTFPKSQPLSIKNEPSWDTFRRWRQMQSSAKGMRLRWQLLEEGKRIKGPIATRAKWVDYSHYCEEVAKFKLAHSKPYNEELFYSHDPSKLGSPVTVEQSNVLKKAFWFFESLAEDPKEIKLILPTIKEGDRPNAEAQQFILMHQIAMQGEIKWIEEQKPIQLKSNDLQLSQILKSIEELKLIGADTPLFCVTRHAELQVNLLSTAAKIVMRKQGGDLEQKDEWGRPLKYSHDVEKLLGKKLELFRGDPRYCYARFNQLTGLIADVEQLCHIQRNKGFLTKEEERLVKQKGWNLEELHKEFARYVEQARRRTNLALKIAKEVLASFGLGLRGD